MFDFLSGYRTKLGVLLFVVGGLFDIFSNEQVLTSFPWLEGVSEFFQTVGGGLAAIGLRFKK
jgi:hypothetical protein